MPGLEEKLGGQRQDFSKAATRIWKEDANFEERGKQHRPTWRYNTVISLEAHNLPNYASHGSTG